ncbi:unnamed protein product [Ascophyllum nodosum]
MVVVRSRRKCKTEGCGKRRSFGVAGTKTAEYCAQHAKERMVDVVHKKYRTEGCGKRPSFGVVGKETPESYARNSQHGMVNVKKKRCTTGSHTIGRLSVKGCRGLNIGSHNSEEVTANVSLTSLKRTRVDSSTPKTSVPSGVCGGPHKRARQLDIASAASMGVVAQESSGRPLAMPVFKEQASSVARDSPVKTEVQLSL